MVKSDMGIGCRSGGDWYSCLSGSGSRFVGCCLVNPCFDGCPAESLKPASFSAEAFGRFPDASCNTSVQFYTCASESTFWGCCTSVPCANSPPNCPESDFRPAFLQSLMQVDFYGSVSGTLESSPVHSAPVARVSSAVAASNHFTSVEKLGRQESLTSVGISIALIGLMPLALIIWLLYRRLKCKVHSGDCEPDRAPLQNQLTTSMAGNVCNVPSDYAKSLDQDDVGRLGTKSLYILGATLFIELCICTFLAFLWFGNAKNRIWNSIMVNAWATRSISIAALLLRTAVALQAGIGSAILASLFLESTSGVQLHQITSLSSMRNGGATPWTLAWCAIDSSWKTGSLLRHSRGLHILAGSLLVTTTLLQFSSTLLLTDLNLGPLVTSPYVSQIPTDFSYLAAQLGIPRSPAWTVNQPSYPIFGEFHEPLHSQDRETADTGVLLRALLPFELSDTRQRLSVYSGNTMVLDSRVSCQAPSLTDLRAVTASYWTEQLDTHTHAQITGLVGSTEGFGLLQEFLPTRFSCTMAGKITTVCQLQQSRNISRGSLKAQFENSTSPGTAFLVLDNSAKSKTSLSWQSFDVTQGTDDRKFSGKASLCFAPWSAAVLNVTMSSKVNQTEPTLKYMIRDFTEEDSGTFQTQDIIAQLIPSINSTARRTMEMQEPGSYLGDLPPLGRRPIVQSDMSGSLVSQTNQLLTGNWSAILSTDPLSSVLSNFEVAPTQYIGTDPAVAAIFEDILDRTSIEWALSALITILSMTNYYGQLSAFDRLDNVTLSFFEDFLYPRDHLGLTLTMWCLTAHVLIVAVLVILFVLKTRLTLLGNAWSAFVQIAESPEVMSHVAGSSLQSDAELIKRWNQDDTMKLRGRLERKDGGAEVVMQ